MNYINHSKVKFKLTLLNLLIDLFFINFFYINITKKIKKDNRKSCERYRNLSKEEKEKKQQYGYKRHGNLSEDEKKAF